MKPFYQLDNQIGLFYTQGQLEFDSENPRLFSPVQNTVMQIDLTSHQSSLLPLTTSYSIQLMQMDLYNEILFVSDEQNYIYIYSIKQQRILGKKRFGDKISQIKIHPKNSLIFVASGRFVFIYEKPQDSSDFLYEPFLLVKKYNTASNNEIQELEISSNFSQYFIASDDSIVRLLPIFPQENKDLFENQIFEFKGHKSQLKLIKDDFQTTKKLLTLDANGLLLVWQLLVQQLEENINEQQQEEKIKEQEKQDQIPQKKSQSKFKFILAKKTKIFQQETSIQEIASKKDLVLFYFKNQSLILYQIDFEKEEILITLTTFKISNEIIKSIHFHWTKNIIAFGGEQGQLSVWNFQSKMFMLQQSSVKIQISDFDFSPEGDLIAMGDYKGDVRLYSQSSGYCLATFDQAHSKITGCKFIKNNVLITSSLDGVLRAYDLTKNLLFWEMKSETENQITCLAIEKNGEVIFTGNFDPFQIHVWSFKNGKLLETLEVHSAPISHIQFSTLNSILISAAWDNTIRLTNIFSKDSNSETINIGQRVMDLKIDEKEQGFGVLTFQGEFQMYQISSGNIVALISLQNDFLKESVLAFDFLSNCNQIAVIGTNNFMHYYDIAHRSLYQKQELILNFSYANTKLKKNSKNIVDGIDLQELKIQQQMQFSAIQLPGSQHLYKKKIEQAQMGYFGLRLNRNQDLLYLVSVQGIQIMNNKLKNKRNIFYWNITKESLLQLIRDANYVEYIQSCLEIKNTQLTQTCLFRLKDQDISCLIKQITLNQLEFLVTFLNEKINGDNAESVLKYVQYLLIFWRDLTHEKSIQFALRQLLLKLKHIFGDLNNLLLENESLIEYVEFQLKRKRI